MHYYKSLLIFALLTCLTQTTFAQEKMLCQGAYWTEDEGNKKLKEFASSCRIKPVGRTEQ